MEQQQLSQLRLKDAAEDEQRDWAALPHDLLRTCISALEGDEAPQRAALASCKALGRAVAQALAPNLRLEVTRHEPFRASARLWQELWGEERPQQDQDVVLGLFSDRQSRLERCWRELLGANARMAFVTQLRLQVRAEACAARRKRHSHCNHALSLLP